MTTITINGKSYNLVTLPSSPAPSDVTLGMNDTVGEVIGAFDREQQEQLWPGGDWWDAQIGLPPMPRAQAADWEGFLADLQGKLNVFQIGDPRAATPLGSALGVPVVTGTGTWTCPVGVTSVKVLYATKNCTIASGQQLAFSGVFFGVLGSGVNLATSLANYSVTGTGSPSGSSTSVSTAITVVPGTVYQLYATVDATHVTALSAGVEPGVLVMDPTLATTYIGIGQGMGISGQVGNGNAAMTRTLQTTGWTASTSRLLLRGDYLQLGYRLHRVCDTVNSDAGGNATIRIWPSLREQPADGTALTLAGPVGLFRLADNRRQSQASPQRLTTVSLQFIEVK